MDRPPNKVRSFQIPLTTRARVSRDVDEELRGHLAMRIEELMRTGLSRADAERMAHAQFGDVDAARQSLIDEDMRRVTRVRHRTSLESWHQDLRYAWRQLLAHRVFSIVAVLTLALGTGVTIAIFSIVDGVLLRPLPQPASNELVRLFSIVRGNRRSFSVPDFLDYRRDAKAIGALAAYYDATTNYVHAGDPVRFNAARTTDNFFNVLKVQPLIGRAFAPGEDQVTAPRVALLNESLWLSTFGGDSTVLGRTLQLDGYPTEVIGVVPSALAYPAGVDLWLTTRFTTEEQSAGQRGARWIRVIGRLAPGRTLVDAQTEVTSIASRLEQADSAHNKNVTGTVMSLQDSMVGSLEKPLFTLLVAVGFVLLIAAVNVANLSLARATARESELAIRAALGAGRRRLMRQLVTECALLGIVGTLAGLLVAQLSLGALLAMAPSDLPRLDAVSLDARVYAFAVLLAVAGGLAIGLVPALHVGAVNVAQRLREGGRSLVRGQVQRRRQALVVGEVALAVMLLAGAGLMVRTLGALRRVDPGFDPRNVYAFTATLPATAYPSLEQQHRFAVRAEERLRALPGVTDVGLSFALPLTDGRFSLSFEVRGRPPAAAGAEPTAQMRVATPGYFSVLRIPVKRGRHLNVSDHAAAPRVVVINEEFARRYFPNEDPLGLYIECGWQRDSVAFGGTVVGVVGDLKNEGLGEAIDPFMYVPEAQWPFDEPTFVVRTASETINIASAVRETMRSIDAMLPIFYAQPLQSIVISSVSQERFLVRILSLFSLLAVTLSAIGIYGVVAYGVEQRRRELGVRIALGASRDRVLGLVLRDGVRLALLGGALGVVGAIALTRLIKSVLFGVTPTDPLTFILVTLALLGVAFVASLAPAIRAARLQPTTALRES